ncbi:MAG: TIGR00296 family protein [Thermoplasmata archaeon]|nr:MAG: TIGR00296 family protein [Thermoplasmata archaeon]
MYSLEDGRFAVTTARKIVEAGASGREYAIDAAPEIFKQKSGVFVTISTFPKHNLRGCIGYPEPVFPLIEALEGAAQSAALRDPRFPPVREDELDGLVIEVSLLTPPELIQVDKPKQYVKEVKIGRDGLIVERGIAKGLLLPQVPAEWKWKTDEFLSHTCMKAGLPADCWLAEGTKIYKFTAEIFAETEPNGEVVLKQLGD